MNGAIAPPRSLYGHGVLLGLLVLAALLPLSVHVGSEPIPLAVVWQSIVAFDSHDTRHLLVHHLRIPRTLLAVLVGAALGVAGTVMQGLTRNPLADPGILGINAGAALGVVCAIAFAGIGHVFGHLVFGLIGAALAGMAVYLLGGVRGGVDPVRLVLAGAALSAVLLTITHIIILNSQEVVFDQFRHWMVGSLQGRGRQVLVPVAVLVAVGLALAFALARALDAVALGRDLGRSLGANPARVWLLAGLAVIVLAGSATAAAGPVAFVGLTAPHIARFLVGSDHRQVMPVAMLLSAVLVLAADCAGRMVAHPDEIGVGIMVALIGGPFFIALARRRRLVQL